MFPFSIRGSIKAEINQTYSPELEQAVLNRVRDRLQKEKPKSIEVDQNNLHFKRGFSHLFGYSMVLDIIERGSIIIEPEGQGLRVEYELWFIAFIVTLTIVLFVIRFLSTRQGWFMESPIEFIFTWLLIGLVNILISVIRFRIMLRAEISKV